MNNSPTILNTEALSTPYRHTEILAVCHLCKGPGEVTCPRCGATFCLTHGTLGKLCADCDLELAFRRNRVISRGCFFIGVPGTVFMAGFASVMPLHVTVALIITVVFLGLLVLGLAVKVSQLRFLAEGHGKSRVALDSLAIAPRSAEEDSPRRRRAAYGHRGRGEPPQIPMWQRTYGAG